MSGFAPPPAPGMPPQSGPPPGFQANPAYAEWLKEAQRVQAIEAENARKQTQFDAAIELIRKDGIHGFRLDIEADSTIAPDENAEKQARVEFLQQMVPLLEQVVPIAQGNPPLAALAREITMFAARGFKVSRPLEESLEAAFDAIAKMAPNPKFSGQGEQKAGADPKIEAAKIAASSQDAQTKAETDRMAIAQKAASDQQAAALAAQKLQFEAAKAQQDAQFEAEDLRLRTRQQWAHELSMAAQNAKGLGDGG